MSVFQKREYAHRYRRALCVIFDRKFNAQQIEKASACGLTYNIEAGRCENAENMTEYQKEFMATGNLG